jgi:hypothetical protein
MTTEHEHTSSESTSESRVPEPDRKRFVPPLLRRETDLVDGTAERTFFTDSMS